MRRAFERPITRSIPRFGRARRCGRAGRPGLRTLAAMLAVGPAVGWSGPAQADDAFGGRFVEPQSGAVVHLRSTASGYGGTLEFGSFRGAIQAVRSGAVLQGVFETPNGPPMPFRAFMDGPRLRVETPAGVAYYSRSPAPRPKSRPSERPPRSGAAARRISGSRLYVMTKASILSRHQASAYREIDFCSGGIFRDRSESSFSVGGEYDGSRGHNRDWAAGAAANAGSGRWSIVDGSNGPVLRLQWRSGGTADHPLHLVLSGSWSYGRTRHAMDWGKGSCS